MLTKFLNRFMDSYSVNEVMNYWYPDYRPQYNEVISELSKFHYDFDQCYERVYNTEYIFNYFSWLHQDDYESGGHYRLRKLLGLSSIEELVDMMDSDSESESEEDIEYNREDIEYNYYKDDNGMDGGGSIDYCC